MRAIDPDGDALSFILLAGPKGMILDKSTGLLRWRPQATDEGQHQVQVSVDDAQGGVATQSFAIQVVVAPPNQPPVITSEPTFEAHAEAAYAYPVIATDPDGEQPHYELFDFPSGMTIDQATGLIQWTPSLSQVGLHVVTVAAIDAAGAGSLQGYRLLVRQANQAPEIITSPTVEVTAGTPYRYDAWAEDPDGDPMHYSLVAAPQGMSIDQQGRITWNPNAADLGPHQIELAAADDFGATDVQTFELTVIADQDPPRVSLLVSQNPAAWGTTVHVAVSATDNVSVQSTMLTMAGTPVALDANGRATITADQAGSFEFVATATDTAGNESQETATLVVIDPSVVGDPIVTLTSPAANAVLTAPADVIGTADDPDLLYYTLSVALFGTNSFREIARGTGSVVAAALGTFDPSLLTNDSYILRLYAIDTGGNDASTQITVSVAGDLKLGNFTLAFNDLTIPVSGIPITVTRTYDTLQSSESGELGYGWSLAFRDTRLRTNVARTGLEGAGIYGAFRSGTRVSLTVPGGRREGFTFRPVSESFFGLTLFYPAFVPDPGVTSTLTVPDVTLQPKPDGFHEFGMGGPAYNPASYLFGGMYTLTTKEGLVYRIDAQSGQLLTATDRNNNVLTFTDAGIGSSTGKRIDFQRDSRGRITAVIDPLGNRVRYQYDQRGDLVSVIDRQGNSTRFAYRIDPPHYLEKVVDPLGRTGVRTEYDADGRLVKLYDALGNPVELIHDLDNSVETVLDALGNPTSYEYDGHGNIVTEINALGGVTSRTYDGNGNMLTETDPLGRQTTYTYDGRGNVLTNTDPLGNVTRQTYDSFGNVLTVTNILGHTIRNEYDNRGNLVSTTDPNGAVTQFTYDSAGRPLVITDPGGNLTLFEYDAHGDLTRQTDALGHEVTFTYDSNGNRLSERQEKTTPQGSRTLTTSTEHDAAGRVLSVTDAEGDTTRSEFDAIGQRVASIDALGRRTQFVYDQRGLMIETILPDATPTELTDNPRLRSEYDAAGREIVQIDELGRRIQFVYDALGRLTTTIYPDDSPADDTDNPRTGNEYDAAGQLVAQIDELGHRTEFKYDEAGRQTVVRDALGNETTTAYLAVGYVASQTNAAGHKTTFKYDDGGRQTGWTFADGSSVSVRYDDNGRAVSRTDQAGRVTAFEYNALGHMTAVVDALSQRTVYGHDELGNLVVQTDANQHATTFEYDGRGQRTATTLPLGQRSETQYDALGNAVETTDFNGTTIRYQYDERNRLVSKEYPDSSRIQYSYTLNGLRETVTDSRGVTHYEYDERDRLVRRTDPDGRQISYTYDDAGNRTSVTVPSGTVTYQYDELDRPQSVTGPDQAIVHYHYDVIGQLVQTDLPNGTTETRQYDALDRLTYLEHAKNSEIIASYLYELNDVGHRISVTEHNGRGVEYAYDQLYRLLGESIRDSVNGDRSIQYTYDPVGNRLTRDDSLEGLTEYTYDDNDRMLTETLATDAKRYEYDANGNTLRKVEDATDQVLSEYQWDYENRLVAADTDADGSFDVQYQYDPDGNRVAQAVDGQETRFLVDTNHPYAQVLEEYTPGGVIKVSYIHGLDLISQTRSADGTDFEKTFYHADGLGSTRMLTDLNGEVVNQYIYDAYGRTIAEMGTTGNVYLFAGERRDFNVGLDYLRARYLNPAIGRFVSRDSFSGIRRLPITQHKYMYAHDNPANFTDPTGLFSLASLSVSVSIVGVLASIALPQFIFAGLTMSVMTRVWKPAFEGRKAAILLMASAGDLRIERRAYELYRKSIRMISVGADLIEINKAALDFANVFPGVSGAITGFASASTLIAKGVQLANLGIAANEVVGKMNDLIDKIQRKERPEKDKDFGEEAASSAIWEFTKLALNILSNVEYAPQTKQPDGK